MTAKLCVAIRETTTADALSAAREAAKSADLVEIRADYIRDLDVRYLLRDKPCRIIFTLRAGHEGGLFKGTERNRIEVLLQAAREGADYVDVEFSSYWKGILDCVAKERVILSYHNFDETPEGLQSVVDDMSATGAGILKVATRARCIADNARIARLLEYATVQRLNLIGLAMGREGIPSRVLGPLWGSWATFASLGEENSTADGQLPLDAMVRQYRVREIDPLTQIYGVLGRPLAHSLSPLVHNTVFAAEGRNAVFLPLEATSLEDFEQFQDACHLKGASVTIPYKERVRALAHSFSVAADGVGAVNTLVRRERGWHGENTDVDGFLRPLLRRKHLKGVRSVVLGAGGAARAVVYALCSQGAQVCVVARDESRARRLADAFHSEHAHWSQLRNLKWVLLVNATPLGTYPNTEDTPVPAEFLRGEWVFDLVYNPRETRLIREASARGCRTISGDEMFLGQALKQQQLWFGSPGPEYLMREALERSLRTNQLSSTAGAAH